MPTAENGEKIIVLRWSQFILSLAVYLLIMGVIYGKMRTDVDQAQAQMQELKKEKVEQKQFDELRDDIIRRLDRIENKVDRDKVLREIH